MRGKAVGLHLRHESNAATACCAVGLRTCRARWGYFAFARRVPLGYARDRLGRHPAVLACYGVDEPPTTGWEAGLRAFRNAVRQADPYHPVYVSGSTLSEMNAYDLADIHGPPAPRPASRKRRRP